MRTHLAALLLLAPVTACATPGEPEAGSGETAAIRLELGPCFGFCPVFNVKIGADGEGIYNGTNFVASRGERRFQVSDAEFAAFAERLAVFRPESSRTYDRSNCDGPVATDNPSIKVTWIAASGEEVVLNWYMGCRQPGLVEQRDRIYDAWQELPALAELVGMSEHRQEYRDK